MPSFVDMYLLEKQVGTNATKLLRQSLKSAIQRTTKSRTGLALKSATSRAVYKNERLQRITLKAPSYIFKQNYGFEGTKKNGVKMRLKATDVLSQALNSSNVLDKLADSISEIRAEQVIAAIKFNTTKNGN
jgi:hypothetical protein